MNISHAAAILVTATITLTGAQAQAVETDQPTRVHYHWIRGHAPLPNEPLDGGPDAPGSAGDVRTPAENSTGAPVRGSGTSASSNAIWNVTFHGGNILNHVSARVVFAGIGWTTPGFINDKIVGIDTFFAGYSGSHYAGASDEYIGANGEVGSTLTYQGHSIAASESSVDGTKVITVTNAVCAEATGGKFLLDTSGNETVVVYTQMQRPKTVNYCGYHGQARCGGHVVNYAFVWDLDQDAACDAGDLPWVNNHSDGLSNIANITAHELAEIRTDPAGNAWHDASQAEVADKCAFVFGHDRVSFANGSTWRLQTLWSNKANNAGNGFYSGGGIPACVDGQ